VVPVTQPVDHAKSRMIQSSYLQRHRAALFKKDHALADGSKDAVADNYTA